MNWPRIPLGQLAEIVGGSTPRREEPRNWGPGHYWATPTDLPKPGEGILDLEATIETITDEGLRSCSTNLLPVGSVLYSTRATIGKMAIAKVPMATNQGFNNLIAGPAIYNRYLAYAVHFFTPDISLLAGSTTFKEVSRSSLRGFKIPVPPISEQHRIVELLDEADCVRRLRREADSKAARILPALFRKMFGEPAANSKGWQEKALAEVIASIDAGWSSQSEPRPCRDGEFGVLKVSSVTSGLFRPEEHKAVPRVDASRALIKPKRGDLLFSRANTRELVAAACVVEDDFPNLFLPDKLWRLTPVQGAASTLFLKELFWCDGIRDNFRALSSGSSGSMLNISQDAVLRTVVPLPPFDLQMRYENLAWSVMHIASQARRRSDEIEGIWANLLQRAFSGQLTANWHKVHMKELQAEMQQQARLLHLPSPKE
jgi:type I restriction enzyme S subunit